MTNVQISQNEYVELKFYKKLVENNLQESLNSDELKIILNAKNSGVITEKEFLNNHPDLKNV